MQTNITTLTAYRKRCVVLPSSESDLESEFEECNMEDALAIERQLRSVAKKNSLSEEEMRMLLQVRNGYEKTLQFNSNNFQLTEICQKRAYTGIGHAKGGK